MRHDVIITEYKPETDTITVYDLGKPPTKDDTPELWDLRERIMNGAGQDETGLIDWHHWLSLELWNATETACLANSCSPAFWEAPEDPTEQGSQNRHHGYAKEKTQANKIKKIIRTLARNQPELPELQAPAAWLRLLRQKMPDLALPPALAAIAQPDATKLQQIPSVPPASPTAEPALPEAPGPTDAPAPANTEKTGRRGRLEKEIVRWLRERWMEAGCPGASKFFQILKHHKGVMGSPIMQWYESGRHAGIEYETSNSITGKMAKGTIENRVAKWNNNSRPQITASPEKLSIPKISHNSTTGLHD